MKKANVANGVTTAAVSTLTISVRGLERSSLEKKLVAVTSSLDRSSRSKCATVVANQGTYPTANALVARKGTAAGANTKQAAAPVPSKAPVTINGFTWLYMPS